MAQVETFTWTNPNPAVARDLDVGFEVAEITTVDITNGGSWYWNDQMSDAYALDVDAGTIATSNGFVPLAESINYGAAISGMTNANPAVITVDDTSLAGFAVGDTIAVVALADDGAAAASLNGTYTIASLTATTITTATDTSSGYSAYVSGGSVIRVSDANGDPIPTENFARRGITCGTTGVGGNSAVMTAVVRGKESVT